jgi:hypothetical protein
MVDERKLFIKILQLNCFITDEIGFDELYLVVNNERIWPENHLYKSINPGSTRIDVKILDLLPNTQIDLEVWDYDYLSSNDLLGKILLLVDEPGGPYTTDMIPNQEKTEKAKYSIVWEIDYMPDQH